MIRNLTFAMSVLLVSQLFQTSIKAQEDVKTVSKFVNKYCVSCHGSEQQEADRRFDGLSSKEVLVEQTEVWHEILDRLNLADMPPEDAELQPSEEERVAIAEQLSELLTSVNLNNLKPQTVFRRLNRQQYDAAVRDVLGLEKMLADPTAEFTPDETKDHFDSIADTLVLSDFLLTRYLEASGEYLNYARELASAKPMPQKWTFKAPFCRNMPNPDGQDRDGQYQHIRENATDHFGYLWLKELARGVPASGQYRIRTKASAINRDYPYKDWIIDVPREDPLQMSIVAGDRRAGDLSNNNPTDKLLFVTDIADDKPQWYETTAWLDQHYQPRFGYPNGPVRIKYMRHLLMHNHRNSFKGFIKDRVHIFHSMHPDFDKATAPALEQQFLDEQEQLKNAGKPYAVFGSAHSIHTDDAWKQFYSEYQGPRIRVYEIQIEGPLLEKSNSDRANAKKWFPEILDDAIAKQLIIEFTEHAYRRPVDNEDFSPIVQLYHRQRSKQESRSDALKVSYQAILCSPKFLYHRANAGELSQHELASRLSFFLWGTPPDRELRSLADEGKLRTPELLKQQADRLLSDPRSQQMVANFTDAWLQLSKLGTMLPDRVEHPGYFNERLEEAMRSETRLYVADAIKRNLDVSIFVDSDYSFLNSSLARLYNINNVPGHEFRRVKLPDRTRGGLLGQASVLTASANGIDTSPVVRGVWVMECLLGTPPSPPPPDVEPLEPDIRGAKTIREQLAMHRDVATCNACHRRFDPPGFALESFDEIGRFRSHYMHGPVGDKQGAKVDPSGKLSSGESFGSVVELKSHLMKRLDLVTNNIAKSLLAQATGRLEDPSDLATIRRMVRNSIAKAEQVSQKPSKGTSSTGSGMKTLIHQLIQSEAFHR